MVCAWLLAILVVLHYYWYGLFLAMGWGYLKTGKTRDIQHRVDTDVDQPDKHAVLAEKPAAGGEDAEAGAADAAAGLGTRVTRANRK